MVPKFVCLEFSIRFSNSMYILTGKIDIKIINVLNSDGDSQKFGKLYTEINKRTIQVINKIKDWVHENIVPHEQHYDF